MLDPANELSPRNYSREDESARRLWLTQRTKANPWTGRTPDEEEDEDPEGRRRRPARPVFEQTETVIEQTDELALEASQPPSLNPFDRLLIHRQHP